MQVIISPNAIFWICVFRATSFTSLPGYHSQTALSRALGAMSTSIRTHNPPLHGNLHPNPKSSTIKRRCRQSRVHKSSQILTRKSFRRNCARFAALHHNACQCKILCSKVKSRNDLHCHHFLALVLLQFSARKRNPT